MPGMIVSHRTQPERRHDVYLNCITPLSMRKVLDGKSKS